MLSQTNFLWCEPDETCTHKNDNPKTAPNSSLVCPMPLVCFSFIFQINLTRVCLEVDQDWSIQDCWYNYLMYIRVQMALFTVNQLNHTIRAIALELVLIEPNLPSANTPKVFKAQKCVRGGRELTRGLNCPWRGPKNMVTHTWTNNVQYWDMILQYWQCHRVKLALKGHCVVVEYASV